jgi:hypothetical protein
VTILIPTIALHSWIKPELVPPPPKVAEMVPPAVAVPAVMFRLKKRVLPTWRYDPEAVPPVTFVKVGVKVVHDVPNSPAEVDNIDLTIDPHAGVVPPPRT